MSFKFLNRVRMSVSGAAGTGSLVINAPAAGFQSLTDAGMAYGDTCPYVIEDIAGTGQPVGTAWEIGVGTWNSNGTFSRDTVTQSSAGGSTKISTTVEAILSATFRAEDVVGKLLSDLADVDISSPGQYQSLRFDSSTDKWKNSGDVVPAVFVQAAGGIATSGLITVTLPQDPTRYNYLIGFAAWGDGTVLSSAVPPAWDSSWDYVNTDDIYASFAIKAVKSGDAASTAMFTVGSSGTGVGIAGVFELALADITRFSNHMHSAGVDVVASNPTTLHRRVLSLIGSTTLYFYGGPNVTTSRSGVGVTNDATGSSGGYKFVLAHDTSVESFDGADTTVNGTGSVVTHLMTLTGVER